jgi:hypothetical protein
MFQRSSTRGRFLHIRLSIMIITLTALVACGRPVEPPVRAVQEFLAAVHARDCARAWTYFSTETRARIEVQSRERVRREPYYAEQFAPQNLYCLPTYAHRFHAYQPQTAQLTDQSSGEALVTLKRHDASGFRMPGFFPTSTDVVEVEIRLIEENGAWKLVLP